MICLHENRRRKSYGKEACKTGYEEHKAEISDPCHLLLIFDYVKNSSPVGYALVILDYKSEIFELRRIAIDDIR